MAVKEDVTICPPEKCDGLALHQLIARCPPLDTNSSYCNFLQCSHFNETGAAAKIADRLVGFISAYIIPSRPDTVFVWQVAVDESARGLGLASRMLSYIVQRDSCANVQYLETTITRDNTASWALFERLAKTLGAPLNEKVWLDKERDFQAQHESEILVRIGPFNVSKTAS